MKKIIYLYRHPGKFYSIEKVFSTLKKNCNNNFEIKEKQVPCSGASLKSIIKNLYYALSLRKEYIHITGDIHYIILALNPQKCILTIHDIRMLHLLKGIKRFIFYLFWIKLPILFAKNITCISNNTKEDIIKLTNVNAKKIHVISNPIDDEYKYNKQVFNSFCPRILHVGTMENKNLERVIKALEGIKCKLIIIGRLSLFQIEYIKTISLSYINKYDLTDNEMVNEFINSDIISFPSLAEGFGMPIIQGQAVGRVVLTSNLEPMREIAGYEGAELVNPYDIESIRRGFLKLINDKDYRSRLIDNGLDNIKRFNSKFIFSQYEKIYDKLI